MPAACVDWLRERFSRRRVTREDPKEGSPVLAGTRRAHHSSRLITHFGPNGLLWLISRKCVTPPVAEPAFQAPPRHIPSLRVRALPANLPPTHLQQGVPCTCAHKQNTKQPPGPSRPHSSSLPPTHFRPNGLLWHILRKCVAKSYRKPASQPPSWYIPSLHVRALPANLPSTHLQQGVLCTCAHKQNTKQPPGPSRPHSFSLPPTHFRQNGFLWHILRKCVTPFRPEPASQAFAPPALRCARCPISWDTTPVFPAKPFTVSPTLGRGVHFPRQTVHRVPDFGTR